VVLGPGRHRPGRWVDAAVEVNPTEGILVAKGKTEASTPIALRIRMLPRCQGHRQGGHTLGQRAPRRGIRAIGMAERPRVDGDFVELDLAGLLIETICPTPQDPLGAGRERRREGGSMG
jgi:hypothetical protein